MQKEKSKTHSKNAFLALNNMFFTPVLILAVATLASALNPIIGVSECKNDLLCCQAMGAPVTGTAISQIIPNGPPLAAVACKPLAGFLTPNDWCVEDNVSRIG